MIDQAWATAPTENDLTSVTIRTTGDPTNVVQYIASIGGRVANQMEGVIEAYIPMGRIAGFAAMPNILELSPIRPMQVPTPPSATVATPVPMPTFPPPVSSPDRLGQVKSAARSLGTRPDPNQAGLPPPAVAELARPAAGGSLIDWGGRQAVGTLGRSDPNAMPSSARVNLNPDYAQALTDLSQQRTAPTPRSSFNGDRLGDLSLVWSDFQRNPSGYGR